MREARRFRASLGGKRESARALRVKNTQVESAADSVSGEDSDLVD